MEMENTKDLENMEISKDNLLNIMKKVDNTSANLELMTNYFSMLNLAIENSRDEQMKDKAMTLYLTLINDKALDNLQYVTENAMNDLKDANNKLSYMVDKAKD